MNTLAYYSAERITAVKSFKVKHASMQFAYKLILYFAIKYYTRVEVTKTDKHSSLVFCGKNYCRKNVLWYNMLHLGLFITLLFTLPPNIIIELN
jgi:hypothetical protein